MKNGLLLTLKELIKLGVIKIKKKRRNKNKRLKQIEAFEKALNTSVPVNPQTRRYADFVGSTAPPQFQPNTDALRLRDTNDIFNTKLLEYKNDLTSQKLLLNDQQLRQQALENDVDVGREFIMRELIPITNQSGYIINDPIDVSQTFGSDTFEPQTRLNPLMSETQQPPRSVTEEDFFTSDAEPQQTQKSVTEEDFLTSDIEPPLKQPLIESESEEEVPYVRTKKQKKKKIIQGPVVFEEDALSPSVAGGGGSVSFNPLNISYSKRPTFAELELWRKWYLQLGLKDKYVLQTNKRTEYKNPITTKLLDEYKLLRGEKNPIVLKSKDPQFIYKAIRDKMSGIK